MAQLVKIPYFTVNKYGQLTLAGETPVSIPDSVAPTWSSIVGKPLVFPPSSHTHSVYDLVGFSLLNDTGSGSSLIADPYTNKVKKLKGAGLVGLSSDAESVTVHVPAVRQQVVIETAVPLTLDETHEVVVVSNGSAITLPTAVGIKGRTYNIIRSGSSNVTIAGSEPISGDASLTLISQWDSLVVVSNDIYWIRCS
jgi:hypothetical protein